MSKIDNLATLPPKKVDKKSKIKLLLIPLSLVLIVAAVIAISTTFFGPDPQVVTFSGGDLNASLFDFKCQIHATIKNNGQAGYTIVTFKVTQDNHTFTKSKKLFLTAGQQKDIMEEFVEVEINGPTPEYVVTAKAE